ncbi:1-phosphofructokinase family hexose kinase (plasmid) [Sphingobium sp. WTD-1]|jgi:6-phosphofructokinase 2|uniref:Phosphofructokinase n=1 Tax=Sphingobium yanoikuyae TaxID=13690 RepID=A0A9X7UFF0_SPHYA|nr:MULTISPECIES: 1-phosphofructokinase family hexose kinase [Sphingobium]QNG49356.1 1-phosphofructokinase family hexose kinase [Sphingobium yanoikuyae]WIA59125.1 1-phosphofructokinase family hexose kinase [Sphingobium sp. WTD-1]
MPSISTLTLNPTIDVAYEVGQVYHTRKMRTEAEFYSPGGGGINVARVFVRLGGNARSYYASGGATGPALDGLLDLHQLVRNRIPIQGHTRVSSAVLERETGKEYRFVPQGPSFTSAEWQACLEQLAQAKGDFLVASGSLPPGVPEDFYGRVATIMATRGIPMVLDSSGPGLKGGLAEGGLFLIKPSIGELRQFVGEDLAAIEDVSEAAMAIVRAGQSRYVAVTMGHEGALLATPDGAQILPALEVDAKSAVGAGDSFLAAMVFALSCSWSITDAFRFGVAAGAAAVLNPGHDLAQAEEIRRLYPQVPQPA